MKFVIAGNNTSISAETCPVCGREAGGRAGGSRIPVEVFLIDNQSSPVCLNCQEEHAPALKEVLDIYYTEVERREGSDTVF